MCTFSEFEQNKSTKKTKGKVIDSSDEEEEGIAHYLFKQLWFSISDYTFSIALYMYLLHVHLTNIVSL